MKGWSFKLGRKEFISCVTENNFHGHIFLFLIFIMWVCAGEREGEEERVVTFLLRHFGTFKRQFKSAT